MSICFGSTNISDACVQCSCWRVRYINDYNEKLLNYFIIPDASWTERIFAEIAPIFWQNYYDFGNNLQPLQEGRVRMIAWDDKIVKFNLSKITNRYTGPEY
jgi:hypothetical protein